MQLLQSMITELLATGDETKLEINMIRYVHFFLPFPKLKKRKTKQKYGIFGNNH